MNKVELIHQILPTIAGMIDAGLPEKAFVTCISNLRDPGAQELLELILTQMRDNPDIVEHLRIPRT